MRRKEAPGARTPGATEDQNLTPAEAPGPVVSQGSQAAEVVAMLSADEARAITEDIRRDLSAIAPKITTAYKGQAWAALGYDSWHAYCVGEFGNGLELAREPRRELVGQLAAEGLSTRAMAPVVGASVATVKRDAAQVARGEPPAPATGLDGKTYSRPATPPAPARRRPLTDLAMGAGPDLGRIASRLEKIAADDRLSRNKDKVGRYLRDDLARVMDVCEHLMALTDDTELTTAPTTTPSGIDVPEGADPNDYENSCFINPSGGVRDLKEVLTSTNRFLTNAYTSPSKPHLDVIDAWLARQMKRATRARKALGGGAA